MTFYASKQKITSRAIRDENDFWLVRNLLIETQPLTPPDFNWDIRRWDGSYYHNEEAGYDARWSRFENYGVRLWETEEGKLVGVVNSEYARGDAFLQLHPDYRYLEEEMIEWAEEKISVPTEDENKLKMQLFVYEYDVHRQRLLEKRGYEKLTSGGVMRRIRFGNKLIPHPALADGYSLRTIQPGDETDCEKCANLLNAAFNRDFHTAKETHTFSTKSPSYRSDLEMFAVAPDGSFAAYVGMIYDEVNKYGLFEPVCTHPDHQRKNLASALIYEGMHRVKALGATDVYVGTGNQVAANKLYESIGFTEVYKGYDWLKIF